MSDQSAPSPKSPSDLLGMARANAQLDPDKAPSSSSWIRNDITSTNWNKLFPYQLLVVDKIGTDRYKPRGGAWTFTLPIPPESLSIDMPFAIQTWITMGGSIEEHNGAPIRMLSIHGSFGVNFGRQPAAAPTSLTFREAVFAGTISAFSGVKATASSLGGGQGFAATNVDPETLFADTTTDTGLGKLTGWYQWRVLYTLFENYAELKRTREGRSARLAFATWKDEAVYLVQPMDFRVSKASGSPLEMVYDLQLKSTKRIKLSDGQGDIVVPYKAITRRPNDLAAFLTSVENCRKLLQGSRKVVAALGADVSAVVFEPMREMALLAKDILSVPLSVADLSDSIIQEAKLAIFDVVGAASAVSNFPQNAAARFGSSSQTARDAYASVQDLVGERSDQGAGQSYVPQQAALGGFVPQSNSINSHPANTPFENPKENFDFFSGIQVGDLRLAPSTMGKVADERERVRSLTREYFEAKRSAIIAASAQFSASLGLGNDVFNRTYGIMAPTPVDPSPPTSEDFDIIFGMNRLVIELNKLVVTNDREPQAKIDAIASVAGFAQRSGIAFRIPQSKYSVPFPYGTTLEMLAARYLNNPNRWHEIAALNGLQTPFVDEEGFDLAFLTNGAGNKVILSDASQLFVGQPVWLESKAAARDKRRITRIEKFTGTQWMVSVDGAADLEKYTTLAHAVLHAFQPNTVNSQQLIFIPSDEEPVEGDFRSKQIPGLDEFDSLIQVGGIDLLLTSQNDLVITPDGDTRWSTGLTNIIQKIRLALSTPQGSLLQHPEYGLPVEVGSSVADLTAQQIASAASAMFRDDPSIQEIKSVLVQMDGGVARIGLNVVVSGSNRIVPVALELKQ